MGRLATTRRQGSAGHRIPTLGYGLLLQKLSGNGDAPGDRTPGWNSALRGAKSAPQSGAALGSFQSRPAGRWEAFSAQIVAGVPDKVPFVLSRLIPVFALGLGLALPAFAQALKVDFNFNNKPLSQTSDPAYTAWEDANIWLNGGDSISRTFDGITFTFTRVGPEGTGLRTDWYAGGIASARMANDGITVEPLHTQGQGGRIQLTLRGLSPGAHTLLTYHNTWQNPSTYSFSPLNVFLNGVQVLTNLPVSNRVTNNAEAAYSYLRFEAMHGQDTIVLFAADTNNAATDQTVCIDGFELDTPNIRFKAHTPTPAPDDEHVDADETRQVLLTWHPALSAVAHHVYYGTNREALVEATPASPEFLGAQTRTNYLLSQVSSLATHFWRIDEVDGTQGVTPGDIWMFRTRHLAFPGAEGYGRFARGGRGGVVVEVTNTHDHGPGSLREALAGNYGPRTIVFGVSGLITLESDLIISGDEPCITLAGQTAPGKGICTRQHQLGVSGGRDLIIRHVRSRPGDLSGTTLNGSGLAGSDHCIMDHVSVSWGIDEELSTRGSKNVTFQRSLISEALNIAGHQNYPPGTAHGYASSVGGDVASLHHNLLAHCEGRNWSLAGGLDANGQFAGRLDIFNNVVYNWGHRTTDGGAHEVNFVSNYYRPGPASTYFYALNAQYGNFPGTQQYYFTGNVMPGHFGLGNQADGRTRSTENGGRLPTSYPSWVDQPFFPSHAEIHTATNALKQVLSDVGCNQPALDDHDARVIRETLDGTHTFTGTGPYGGSPGLPNSQQDVGGWEDYPAVARPADWDTDHDGLPNWWETIHGLNPDSAVGDFSDGNGDPDGDEYTNLEDYLNWLAAPHFDCRVGAPLEIDLRRFARGYSKTDPVFQVFQPLHGTVHLVGDHRVRFVPNVTSNSLGGFSFRVVDSTGDTLTATVGVRLIADAPPPRLGIRRQERALYLDLTSTWGNRLVVETKSDWADAWTTKTNLVGSGIRSLLPLEAPNRQAVGYFRASVQE